jgi:hypothetical protein
LAREPFLEFRGTKKPSGKGKTMAVPDIFKNSTRHNISH